MAYGSTSRTLRELEVFGYRTSLVCSVSSSSALNECSLCCHRKQRRSLNRTTDLP